MREKEVDTAIGNQNGKAVGRCATPSGAFKNKRRAIWDFAKVLNGVILKRPFGRRGGIALFPFLLDSVPVAFDLSNSNAQKETRGILPKSV